VDRPADEITTADFHGESVPAVPCPRHPLVKRRRKVNVWLFYLSFITADELTDFSAWAQSHLSSQSAVFQARFRPVFEGLLEAKSGKTPLPGDAYQSRSRQFLGWSKARHWMLP
jgi:hypothetical protein